ncbi:MAG: NAD-dependent deacetylase [Promethearchaeota archaeon]
MFSIKDVEHVAKIIANSNYMVGFTGAGISTESGLPDYRGPEGVWTLRDKGLQPKLPKKPISEIEPNAGHYAFVDLYELDILKYLISQNVDNLHLKSGIPPEILAELHGNHALTKCLDCDARFTKQEIGWDDMIHGKGYRTERPRSNQPKCPHCKSRIISSIVNFNDPMPEKEIIESENQSRKCDVMLVVGSSLSVYPAAELPVIAKRSGAKLIIINKGPTQLDNLADVRIEAKSGEFLPKVVEQIRKLKNH